MSKLQDHSIFPVWSQTMVSGIIAYIMLMFIFNDVLENPGLFIWFGFIIHIFCPMILCVAVYFPLKQYDEEKLLEYDFKNLLNRYLPIYILPFALIIIVISFFLIEDDFFYEVLLIILSLYFISLSSLIFFIKSIKSGSLEINNLTDQPDI